MFYEKNNNNNKMTKKKRKKTFPTARVEPQTSDFEG